MLDELYNNPSLIIAIVIFLICVIIGFFGDLYLKKVKKEEAAKRKAENTNNAEEQIETLDTEQVMDEPETLTNETPALQVESVMADNTYNVDSSNMVSQETFAQPNTQTNSIDYSSPVSFDNNIVEQPINNNFDYQAPANDFMNSVPVSEPVSFEQPVSDYNSFAMPASQIDEQPVMPTNINSDYNVSMTYDNVLVNEPQSFNSYETPVVEQTNNIGFEVPNSTSFETNTYNEISNEFLNPAPSYDVPAQNLEETRIFEPINNYGFESSVPNDFSQNNNFTDNTSNDNLNNNNNIF